MTKNKTYKINIEKLQYRRILRLIDAVEGDYYI